MRSLRLVLALTVAGLVGCSDTDDRDRDGAPTDAIGDGTAIDPAPLFARAASTIEVIANARTELTPTSVLGALRGAAAPVPHEIAPAIGACRLWQWSESLCEPGCGGGELCIDERCVAVPPLRSAGELAIVANALEVAVSPDGGGAYRASGLAAIAAGATVSAEAPGLEVAGFALAAPMVAPMVATIDSQPVLTAGRDFEVTWAAEDADARVHAMLWSDVGAHGPFYPAGIECDAPDVGTLTIDAALVDAFLDPDNWGCGECPSSWLMRYRRVTTETADGEVELTVGSRFGLYLSGP